MSTCLPFDPQIIRSGLTLNVDMNDQPDIGSIYSILVEHGPTAAGPWTVAALTNGVGGSAATNPVDVALPANFTAYLDALTHNTTYFVRTTADNNNGDPLVVTVCGPVTTGDYPAAVCDPTATYPYDNGPIGHTDTKWQVNATTSGGYSNGDDTTEIIYGTTPGGPYPFTTGPVVGIAAQLTGLTGSTQYYYRARLAETRESNGVFSTSPECTFTTLAPPAAAAPVESEVVKLCTHVSTVGGYCIGGAPVLLHIVATSDGDIIPVQSTTFPAPAGHGIFSSIGFFRSYYADLEGNLVLGGVGACDGGTAVSTEPGCVAGVPFTRVTARTYSQGTLTNESVRYFNSAGVGTTVFPAGFTLGACCAQVPVSLGQICYSIPGAPAQTLTDNWTGSTVVGANGGPQTITNPNFAGSGITVVSTTDFGFGLLSTTVGLARNPGPVAGNIDLGAPRNAVTVEFTSFGTLDGATLTGISPPAISATGGTLSSGGTVLTPSTANGVSTISFAGPVQNIAYIWNHTLNTAGSGQTGITFTTLAGASTTAPAAVVRECGGALSHTDLTTGAVLTPGSFTIVPCA